MYGYWYQCCWLPGDILSLEPCLTTATWRRKNFSQCECSFLWKLHRHWLKSLRPRQMAVVRQDPGHQQAWYWPSLKNCQVTQDCHLYWCLLISGLLKTWWNVESEPCLALYWCLLTSGLLPFNLVPVLSTGNEMLLLCAWVLIWSLLLTLSLLLN